MPPSSSSACSASSWMPCLNSCACAPSPGPSRRTRLRRSERHERGDAMTAARRTGEIAIGTLPIALILALWQGLSVSGVAPAILPPPAAVFVRLLQQFGNPQYWDNAATTLFRLFAGFSIAVAIGVSLGLAATGSRTVEALVRPLVRVLAPLPKVALYPAMILILGFDHASKIALVAADAVFPILLPTHH